MTSTNPTTTTPVSSPKSFPPPKPVSPPKKTTAPVKLPTEPGIIPAAVTAPTPPKGPRTEAPDGCPFRVGVRVNHKHFGGGTVKAWKDDELHFDFDEYGHRMMFYSISARFIAYVSDPADKKEKT